MTAAPFSCPCSAWQILPIYAPSRCRCRSRSRSFLTDMFSCIKSCFTSNQQEGSHTQQSQRSGTNRKHIGKRNKFTFQVCLVYNDVRWVWSRFPSPASRLIHCASLPALPPSSAAAASADRRIGGSADGYVLLMGRLGGAHLTERRNSGDRRDAHGKQTEQPQRQRTNNHNHTNEKQGHQVDNVYKTDRRKNTQKNNIRIQQLSLSTNNPNMRSKQAC